jgi:DcuC family C4-dicarboxylate transporter
MIARGVDVRLVLLLGALPVFLATGHAAEMLAKVVAEMANPGTVVPICSAMGFAYVLRVTECDQHLVELLMQPLRPWRALLIPGGIASGYLINTTIVSQAGTAAVLGPILIPLLRAGGLRAPSAGAILLLGSSAGGELFNPGAVEIRKLAELTGRSGAAVVGRLAPLNIVAFSAALCAFWVIAVQRQRSGRAEDAAAPAAIPAAEGTAAFRVNRLKACVPLVPLLILFADSLMGSASLLHRLDGPARILAAMLLGVAAVAVVSLSMAGGLAAAFFEGAGYAYQHVISLIVAASTFAEAIRLSGLVELVIRAIAPRPALANLVAMALPWALAFVSGTGIAPAVAIMEFFVPAADSMGLEPVRVGALASLGAHFGRTMSPAAAVVMVSSRLARATPRELIREVALPLLAGGAALFVAALAGLG